MHHVEHLARIQVRIDRLSRLPSTPRIASKIERLGQIEEKIRCAVSSEHYGAVANNLLRLQRRLGAVQGRIQRMRRRPDASTDERLRGRICKLQTVEAKILDQIKECIHTSRRQS